MVKMSRVLKGIISGMLSASTLACSMQTEPPSHVPIKSDATDQVDVSP